MNLHRSMQCYSGALIALLLLTPPAKGTVYYSKKEALDLAFGEGAAIEMYPLFLTEAQTAKVQKLARAKVDSQLFTFYIGKLEDKIVGYAAIETHTVRSKAETLLIVLSPTGRLERIHVLAFHEPPEFQPPARWLALFHRRPLDELQPNRGWQAITGATLSSHAALSSVRKVLAMYQIAFQE